MKNNKNQVEEFSNLKNTPKIDWSDPKLRNMDFWGLSYNEEGRLQIDINKYKNTCEGLEIRDFLPNGLLNKNIDGLFIPNKKSKDEYIINVFNDMLNDFARDWSLEFKPIFDMIKTPKEAYDDARLNGLAYTSNPDDLDEIEFDALLSSLRRNEHYSRVIQSLYCQFIIKLAVETDRIILSAIQKLGYKKSDYNFNLFVNFAEDTLANGSGIKIQSLKKYNAYNMLHKISNFLKHNTKESYYDLKRYYPDNVASIKKGTANIKYENGMFAGDWIIVHEDYIDDLIRKLRIFFKDFCNKFVNESEDDAEWNYDEYFIEAFNNLKYPFDYFGV